MSRARSKARRCALQALYSWQLAGQDLADIEKQFFAEQDVAGADRAYFSELLRNVPQQTTELDAHYRGYLDRSVEDLDPIELAILRIGVYELTQHPEIPFRVIINEAVELAKVFGADQSHRYINGVLDKVARTLRAVEVKMKAP
ncbi:MAG: transcription antitermination factor NusB [Pseudomonadota bacterium]